MAGPAERQYSSRNECTKHSVALQAYEDICLSVNGLCDLVEHLSSGAFACIPWHGRHMKTSAGQ